MSTKIVKSLFICALMMAFAACSSTHTKPKNHYYSNYDRAKYSNYYAYNHPAYDAYGDRAVYRQASYVAYPGVDPIGARLIPSNSVRVSAVSGNITLRTTESIDSLIVFYENELREMNAVGSDVYNRYSRIGDSNVRWKWVGTYGYGRPLDITITESDNRTRTIVIVYDTSVFYR